MIAAVAGLHLALENQIEALYKIKDSYNVNMLTKKVAEAALDDEAWMRMNIEKICATSERLRATLAGWGWEVAPSSANFLWARPPEGVSAESAYADLREKRILVRYFDKPGVDDHIRITIGTDEEVDALIDALNPEG